MAGRLRASTPALGPCCFAGETAEATVRLTWQSPRTGIPVEGGRYQLSACMLRESAGDNVLVDFDDGKGRDADLADIHLVAASTGSGECRAVTTCIPRSVGAVRIRAVRNGADLGDAWFDRIELKRIAACAE